VVLFTVPYPPPLLDAIRVRSPGLASADAAALAVLSDAAGLPILRTEAMGSWWTPEDSNDLKHLSADGADAFTRQLWAAGLRERLLPLLDPAATTSAAP
jgi:hypothetical protein